MNLRALLWLVPLSLSTAVHAQRWTTTEALHLNGPSADSVFRDIRGMVVTASGDFYILEGKRAALYRFTADGEKLWAATVPFNKEVTRLEATVVALSNGTPLVFDVSGTHVITFDTSGARISDEKIQALEDIPIQWSTLGPNVVAVTRPLGGPSDGSTAPELTKIKTLPSSLGPGSVITTLEMIPGKSFDRNTMTMGVNTAPPAVIVASTGATLFVADNQHYSISVFDTTGRKIANLHRDVPRKPLTAADRLRATREVAHILDDIPPEDRGTIKWKAIYSDSLPAIAELAVGDSLALVRPGGTASAEADSRSPIHRWDVLGLDDTYLGYLDLPANYRVVAIQGGKLYGIVKATANAFAVVVCNMIAPNKPAK